MAQQNDLELISKLRKDTVLFEKYEGKYGGKGRKKKYGARLKFDLIPLKYLQKSEQAGDEITNYYAGVFWHKGFATPLKVGIIVKLDVLKKKMGHAILFSSDEHLEWEKVINYYRLRFQIEFNFRDARTTFRVGRFYEHDAKRSRKCVKFSISDDFIECEIAQK